MRLLDVALMVESVAEGYFNSRVAQYQATAEKYNQLRRSYELCKESIHAQRAIEKEMDACLLKLAAAERSWHLKKLGQYFKT
jgi:hypothetical protein